MRKLLLIFCFFCAMLSFCRINPNLQGSGENYLQGVWNEDSILYQSALLQYTSHKFKFTCDSFYVTFHTTAKTNIFPDSCYNNGSWLEFAKGIYAVKSDTVYLSGTFTKPNFKQKISGCYRIGQYTETFVVNKKSLGFLELKSLKQHLPVTLKLKEKITCIPQPIN